MGRCVSGTLECSTGAPQGTVLAPFLFTLYTSDFRYNSESCHIQKYSDSDSGEIETVQTCNYPGVVLDNKLEWSASVEAMYRRGQNRLFFLRRLGSFNVCCDMMNMFYHNMSCEDISIHGAVGVYMCAPNSFVFQIIVCSMYFVGKKAEKAAMLYMMMWK